MCYTYRHDYGLNRRDDDPPWVSGMTDFERQGLWRTMAQIFDNDIAPLLKEMKDLYEGNSVVVPKDKEHAEALIRMGMFYIDTNKENK